MRLARRMGMKQKSLSTSVAVATGRKADKRKKTGALSGFYGQPEGSRCGGYAVTIWELSDLCGLAAHQAQASQCQTYQSH